MLIDETLTCSIITWIPSNSISINIDNYDDNNDDDRGSNDNDDNDSNDDDDDDDVDDDDGENDDDDDGENDDDDNDDDDVPNIKEHSKNEHISGYNTSKMKAMYVSIRIP